MGVVNDIETLQVRHGDVILLRPKNSMTDAQIVGVCDQLRSWLDYRRIKVHVALIPADCEIIVIREDRP